MSLFLIVIMTIIFYLLLENSKTRLLFEYLRTVDIELERCLQPYILMDRQVDIFTIQEIRKMIRHEFVNKHLIDEFKIYKEDMYKVCLMLRRGPAVQGLEMITSHSRLELKETSMVYSGSAKFSKK